MRPLWFGLGLVLVSLTSMLARADVAAPSPMPLHQPWAGTLGIETVKAMPHTTRSQIPAMATIYWGVVGDDKAWRELQKREPKLAGISVDFQKESVIFVANEDHGGGSTMTASSFKKTDDGAWHLVVEAQRSTHDIARTYYAVTLARVLKQDVARTRIENGGKVLGDAGLTK